MAQLGWETQSGFSVGTGGWSFSLGTMTVTKPSGLADFCDRINAGLAECGPVQTLADALKLSPLAIFLAAAAFGLGFLLYGFCGQLICTTVGLAYPAFESFKAIEEKDQARMNFWLTYWVVFASLTLFEHMAYLAVVWLPFYYPLKLAFLIWLFFPSTRGAEYIYTWIIMPILQRNKMNIDEALEKSGQQVRRSISQIPTAVSSGAAEALALGAVGAIRLRKSLGGKVGILAPDDEEGEGKKKSIRWDPTNKVWETTSTEAEKEESRNGEVFDIHTGETKMQEKSLPAVAEACEPILSPRRATLKLQPVD